MYRCVRITETACGTNNQWQREKNKAREKNDKDEFVCISLSLCCIILSLHGKRRERQGEGGLRVYSGVNALA